MEYGLIGGKLGHSYSRQIHEQIGGYSYQLHELPTEADARAFMEARDFKGINVTIPYKKLVIPYCDQVEPRAAAIGAVNTLVNRDGKLTGYNTDYDGFHYLAKRHGVRFRGKTVLILGSGGTRNTVAAVARDGGAARVITVSRSGRGGGITYAQAEASGEGQIIINASPAGMFPNNGGCLIDLKKFPDLEAVLDVVYNPFRTELLLRAEELGIPAYCGFEMLVAQAVVSAGLFLDKLFSTAQIDEACHALRREISNVSLIGMPGCGKSTVGRALSRALAKQYVDLDDVIEQHAKMPIPDIFAQYGEETFRRYEAEAVAACSKLTDQVIACGGGVIKTPGNARMLRQNGPVLWIRRPVEKLPTNGRPLSMGGHSLKQMEAERTPLYRAACDASVDNYGRLADTVRDAEEAFEQTFDVR
ncbi:shikimate kinase [uncultured Gemmiger sp.]|uniref:shikimate kinase n=1 Tax=uncultured Gemmiger sp. TaxID=1623490 RepID=UPI0025EFFAEB|nr:shikimate kinase [uncultured Gemmiger sp.]